MITNRFMPCLLLSEGELVKTVRFKKPAYIGDPVNAIKIYNAKEVDELIILDIDASRTGHGPNFSLLAELASECFMPLAYGGGVRTLGEAKQLLQLGIEKVAINSAFAENPHLISEIANAFGNQSIIVSIDVRKNLLGQFGVYTNGASKKIEHALLDYVKLAEKCGAGEILINSIDRDGTMEGYDLDLIKLVSSSVSLPVIACGGAGKIEDLGLAIRQGGASAAAVGSMAVYQGKNKGVLINFPSYQELRKQLV